jgi:hypothetical protein
LAASIPETYGISPRYRGKSCQSVMSKIFKHVHGQSSLVLAETRVSGVRVYRENGFALLHSRAMPHGEIAITREGRSWKVQWPIGTELHPLD